LSSRLGLGLAKWFWILHHCSLSVRNNIQLWSFLWVLVSRSTVLVLQRVLLTSLDRTAETCAGRVGGRRRNDVVASLHFATISRRRLDYDERQRLVATDRNSRPSSSSSSSRFIAIPDHDTSAAANSAMNRPPTDCRSFAPPRGISAPLENCHREHLPRT